MIFKKKFKCDFRHPDVLRFAPVALYNTFHELYCFVYILEISLFKCFPKN
jgi:kynureninase